MRAMVRFRFKVRFRFRGKVRVRVRVMLRVGVRVRVRVTVGVRVRVRVRVRLNQVPDKKEAADDKQDPTILHHLNKSRNEKDENYMQKQRQDNWNVKKTKTNA
jgi:hypothetical protein